MNAKRLNLLLLLGICVALVAIIASLSAPFRIHIATAQLSDDPTLAITIANNGTKDGTVTFENSVMKAVYKAFPVDEVDLSRGYNFAVGEWIDKKTGRNIAKQVNGKAQDTYNAGWCYDENHEVVGASKLTASIVSDDTSSKSVRLKQDGCNNRAVWTIHANSPIFKIQYENAPVHLTDDRTKRHIVVNGQRLPEPHDLTVYTSGDTWRNFMCNQSIPDWCETEIFRNPSPLGNPSDPINGGALSYKDMLIFGYTERSSGQGFGRVMPVSNITWFSNQLNLSHELLLTNLPFTGYLYMVTDGPHQVLTTGQEIADGKTPKTN